MTAPKNALHLISASELAIATLPEPSNEIIGEGQVAVIAAQFGRGKTPQLAHMAVEAACGFRLTPLGLVGCRQPVIVLDGESDPASHRAMLNRLTRAVGIEEWPGTLQFWFKLDPKLTAGTACHDSIASMVTERQPGLLVLAGIKRGVGIVGPWHFTVEENAQAQPCRYRFENHEHSIRERYAHFLDNLPDSFNWKLGRLVLEINDSTMHRFVKAAKSAGMLVQDGGEGYRKVEVRK